MGEYALGQGIPRSEDPRLLKGGGRYVDDVVLPRMSYGAVLRSPHPHAKILSIDTTKARAAPGVLAVLTGADWQASGWRDIPSGGGYKRPDGSPQYVPAFPALVKDRVRRVGDYVAFIVAETLYQAIDAADLVEVDYEPLPAVTGTVEAAAPGAPLVWDDCAGNLCFLHEGGDKAAVEAAFAMADHVAQERFVINRVTASSIEPRGCIGDYDATDDHYTVYTALQGAHPYRSNLSKLMKVPEHKIRVIAGDIGGSFGMKASVFPEVPLVLLASQLLRRPVKWISNRTESFLSDSHGRDNVVDVELALDKAGKFLALRIHSVANLGAYLMQGTVNPPVNNIGSVAGVYTTPAIYVNVKAVFSNTNPTRPYRGAGRPEAAFMIERIVDLAADQIGMDPAELRRINTIPPSAMPYKTGLTFKYDSGEFEKNLNLALGMADYARLRAPPRRIAQARQAARARHLQHHREGGIARHRGRGDPIRPQRHRDHLRRLGDNRRRATKRYSSRSPATPSACP